MKYCSASFAQLLDNLKTKNAPKNLSLLDVSMIATMQKGCAFRQEMFRFSISCFVLTIWLPVADWTSQVWNFLKFFQALKTCQKIVI
jgi:hypothetical protein